MSRREYVQFGIAMSMLTKGGPAGADDVDSLAFDFTRSLLYGYDHRLRPGGVPLDDREREIRDRYWKAVGK